MSFFDRDGGDFETILLVDLENPINKILQRRRTKSSDSLLSNASTASLYSTAQTRYPPCKNLTRNDGVAALHKIRHDILISRLREKMALRRKSLVDMEGNVNFTVKNTDSCEELLAASSPRSITSPPLSQYPHSPSSHIKQQSSLASVFTSSSSITQTSSEIRRQSTSSASSSSTTSNIANNKSKTNSNTSSNLIEDLISLEYCDEDHFSLHNSFLGCSRNSYSISPMRPSTPASFCSSSASSAVTAAVDNLRRHFAISSNRFATVHPNTYFKISHQSSWAQARKINP